MYARVTKFTYKLSRRAEFDAEVEKFRARIEQLPGMIDFYICGDEKGSGFAITFFDSKESAEDTRSFSQAAWAILEGLNGGTPSSDHFDHVTHFPGPLEYSLPLRRRAADRPVSGASRLVVHPGRKGNTDPS